MFTKQNSKLQTRYVYTTTFTNTSSLQKQQVYRHNKYVYKHGVFTDGALTNTAISKTLRQKSPYYDEQVGLCGHLYVMAAILDAILNFPNCSRVTTCQQAVSEK